MRAVKREADDDRVVAAARLEQTCGDPVSF
jgi:hypothetical protein